MLKGPKKSSNWAPGGMLAHLLSLYVNEEYNLTVLTKASG